MCVSRVFCSSGSNTRRCNSERIAHQTTFGYIYNPFFSLSLSLSPSLHSLFFVSCPVFFFFSSCFVLLSCQGLISAQETSTRFAEKRTLFFFIRTKPRDGTKKTREGFTRGRETRRDEERREIFNAII